MECTVCSSCFSSAVCCSTDCWRHWGCWTNLDNVFYHLPCYISVISQLYLCYISVMYLSYISQLYLSYISVKISLSVVLGQHWRSIENSEELQLQDCFITSVEIKKEVATNHESGIQIRSGQGPCVGAFAGGILWSFRTFRYRNQDIYRGEVKPPPGTLLMPCIELVIMILYGTQ